MKREDLKAKKPKKALTNSALGPHRKGTSKSHTKEMGGTPRLQKTPKSSSSPLPNHPRRRRSPAAHRFPEGALIEVQTDEEGFRLVYFTAIVISSEPTGKLHVEYSDLLTEEGGSVHLREDVDIAFVRPAPPPQEIVAGFRVHDAVDAFYNDGWWIGEVARVVDGGAWYVLDFADPPDKRTVAAADLRAHWDWIDGKWTRPARKAEVESMSVGEEVEVTRDVNKPYHHSWFEASILKPLEGGTTFLVEYCALKDDKGELLKGTVSAADVRPCPPEIKDKVFILKEKVDAYFEHGWWTGTIKKLLPGDKYIVFFNHNQSEEEFHQSVLRHHMEWVNEQWSTASKLSQDKHYRSESSSGNLTVVSDISEDKINTSHGNTTSSSKLRKGLHEKLPPVHQKSSEVTTPLSKKRQDVSESRPAPSRASKRRKEVNVLGASKNDKRGTSATQMTPDGKSPVSLRNLTSATPTAEGDQFSGKHSQVKRIRKKGKEPVTPQNGDKVVPGSNIKKSSTPNLQEATVGVQNEQLKKLDEISIVLSLPCATKVGSGSSRGAGSNGSHGKELKPVSDPEQQPDVIRMQGLKATPPETQVLPKKKRGRPFKRQREKNLQMLENELVGQQPDPPTEECRDERPYSKDMENKQFEESSSLQLAGSSERGSTPAENQNSGLHVENSHNVSQIETLEVIMLEPEEDAGELPVNDDEPLSKWIEEMQSPLVNFARVTPAPNAGQNTETSRRLEKNAPVLEENNEKQPEAEGQTSISTNEPSSDTTVQQSLPFTKSTPLWEAIKDFDVFKRIPQNPHFNPLYQVKECSREGTAVGLMVDFSNMVEKVSKLHFRDPDSVITEIRAALDNFREHGFNIKVLEDRISGLVAVKEKQGRYVDEVNELNRQISARKNERCRVMEEISKTTEELKKLQEKLSTAELAKKAEDDEIAALQAKLTENKVSMGYLEHEFQSLASSNLQRP